MNALRGMVHPLYHGQVFIIRKQHNLRGVFNTFFAARHSFILTQSSYSSSDALSSSSLSRRTVYTYYTHVEPLLYVIVMLGGGSRNYEKEEIETGRWIRELV